MNSVAFYYLLDEERVYAAEWAQRHGVQVECFNFELTTDTVSTAQGHDAVCFRQRVPLDEGETIYRTLSDYGIRHIASRSAGLDTVNLRAAHANGLSVTNVPSYSPTAIAELVLTHAMSLIRHIPQLQDRAAHNNYVVAGLMSRELSELTVGIIGVGRIGSRVAHIFHALGARVLGNDIVEHDEMRSVITYVSKEELIKESDIITLHVYLDAATRHIINASNLVWFKRSAYLINASRGAVVDTDALIDALEHRILAGAALDVVEGEATLFNKSFEHETPDARYRRLESMQNVILSPHVGFFTDIAVHNMVNEALDDVLTELEGDTSPHELNFQ